MSNIEDSEESEEGGAIQQYNGSIVNLDYNNARRSQIRNQSNFNSVGGRGVGSLERSQQNTAYLQRKETFDKDQEFSEGSDENFGMSPSEIEALRKEAAARNQNKW